MFFGCVTKCSSYFAAGEINLCAYMAHKHLFCLSKRIDILKIHNLSFN